MLTNVKEPSAPFAYETNVKDISNIYIKKANFKLTFKTKINEEEIEEIADCNFFKYEIEPLIIVCWLESPGTSWLKEITQEIIIKDNNIQYNFRIQPMKKEEKITYTGLGTSVVWSYPRILDFKTRSWPFKIGYEPKDGPDLLKSLTFNENAKNLECEKTHDTLKCEVPKSHFEGKADGYYYLKRTNNQGKRTIVYEIPPIKVTLESKKAKEVL